MEPTLELTLCPECGASAEVLWRVTLDSTDGPVEHARVMCLQKHFLWLPVEWLPTAPVLTAEPAREPLT